MRVETDRLLLAARADAVERGGLSTAESVLLRYLLPRRGLFEKIIRLSSLFQRVLPNTGDEGRFRHLPHLVDAWTAGRTIPDIPKTPFSRRMPVINRPPGKFAGTKSIAFFTGCGTEFLHPDTGERLVRLLTDLGTTVHVPRNQGCCAAPILLKGDLKTAEKAARRNAEVFSGFDTVVTACATCGSTLKQLPFTGDPQIQALSAKVTDLFEFLAPWIAARPEVFHILPEYRGKTLTWHDPCHLNRHQGIAEPARTLLKSLPDTEYVEMENADACCGMGGTFALRHPELSKRIADRKAVDIQKSGADIVATACPGCIIQLNDALIRNRADIRAVHILDLLDPK